MKRSRHTSIIRKHQTRAACATPCLYPRPIGRGFTRVFAKDNEGAYYFGVNSPSTPPGAGSRVSPGQCFDYTWFADEGGGPASGDLSSKVWWYHSHVNTVADVNAGLLGPIIVARRGMANADGSPKKSGYGNSITLDG